MKRIICFILILTVVFSAAPIRMNSAPAGGNYVAINEPVSAKVIEVIDADALVVEIMNTGELALVHMVGIDSAGYTPGFDYVTAKLLGRLVQLVPDAYIKNPVGRWNYARVYLGATDMSVDLVNNGYATVDTTQGQAVRYSDLAAAEQAASNKNLGLWQLGNGASSYAYSGDRVNINTASVSELSEQLKITDRLATAISNYRKDHPFQTIYGVKFVDGMTKALFDEIRPQIVVATNVNEASAAELTMLIGLTEDDADKIIDAREDRAFRSLSDLHEDGALRKTLFRQNEPFISLEDADSIDYTEPDTAVNMNTATESQLRTAGLSNAQARRAADDRADYSFKTMRDVTEALTLSKKETDALSDNLHMKTDINNATYDELRSLFGTHSKAAATASDIVSDRPFSSVVSAQQTIPSDLFARVKDLIYVGEKNKAVSPETDYINLNTASAAQLQAAGFSGTQAAKIIGAQPNMRKAADIPVSPKSAGADGKVTLFTNINQASVAALKTLHPQMTDAI
ncbi:MAG: helix-hairpin-helix domain-containing protein, partial [Clostridiales bacterium]|nr:helix-hairpin-helix domain-containing protein [Clostridiales bacterium]